jgi:hypothetical protein
LFIMILAAIAVSTVVYFITANAEENQFQVMYEGASEKLLGESDTQRRTRSPCHDHPSLAHMRYHSLLKQPSTRLPKIAWAP